MFHAVLRLLGDNLAFTLSSFQLGYIMVVSLLGWDAIPLMEVVMFLFLGSSTLQMTPMSYELTKDDVM